MITEALEYLKQAFKPDPVTITVNDREYSIVPGQNGPSLGSLVTPPAKHTLWLSSLTGFIDAFAAGIDDFEGKVAVHVVDYRTVSLVSLQADEYGRRHAWLTAQCGESNPFKFDEYQVPESFLIGLQSGFLPTENVVSLQRLASSLSSENSIGTQDDGLSQVVTVKQGTMTRDAIPLPPRIPLLAYRTFREIDPIESFFLCRLKGEPGKMPSIALLQIDAGKWKHDTQLVVASYLAKNLPEKTVVIA